MTNPIPPELVARIDSAVSKLVALETKMSRAVQGGKPYPVSVAISDDDTMHLLSVCVTLEHCKAALINPSPIDREAVKGALLEIATKFYAPGSPESRGIITAIEHCTAIALIPAHAVEPQPVQTGGVEAIEREFREWLPKVWTNFLDCNPDDLTSPEDLPDHALMTGAQFEEWALEALIAAKATATPTPVPADGALPALIADAKDRLRLTEGCDMANADDERFWRDVIAFLERREPWFTTTASDATTGASATAGATTDTADGALREAASPDAITAAIMRKFERMGGLPTIMESANWSSRIRSTIWLGVFDTLRAALSTPDQSQPESNGS